jgi:hypothetical protein
MLSIYGRYSMVLVVVVGIEQVKRVPRNLGSREFLLTFQLCMMDAVHEGCKSTGGRETRSTGAGLAVDTRSSDKGPPRRFLVAKPSACKVETQITAHRQVAPFVYAL